MGYVQYPVSVGADGVAMAPMAPGDSTSRISGKGNGANVQVRRLRLSFYTSHERPLLNLAAGRLET